MTISAKEEEDGGRVEEGGYYPRIDVGGKFARRGEKNGSGVERGTKKGPTTLLLLC